jgi:hypothetical protein
VKQDTSDTSNQYLEHLRDIHDPSQHIKTIEDELRGTMGKALGKQGQKILNSLRCVEEERVKYVELMLTYSSSNNNNGASDNDNDTNNKKELIINSRNDNNHNNNNSSDDDGDIDDNSDDNDDDVNSESTIIHNISFETMPQLTQNKVLQIIQSYNKHLKDATKARWELTVHRQAVGFIVNNHKFVQEKFPIPPPLSPLPFDFDESLLLDSDGSRRFHDAKKNVGKETVVRTFGDQLDWWEKIGRWK